MELLHIRRSELHFPNVCVVCHKASPSRRFPIGASVRAPLCHECARHRLAAYRTNLFAVLLVGVALLSQIGYVGLASAVVFLGGGGLLTALWLALRPRAWQKHLRIIEARDDMLTLAVDDAALAQALRDNQALLRRRLHR
jgi:hypothetical protein